MDGMQEEAVDDDKENEDPNKDKEVERTIWPIPEWGIGHGGVSDSIEFFARARTPWQMRGFVERLVGPANDAQTFEWLQSETKQFVFAQYFATPYKNDAVLRSVQSDTDEVYCSPDYSKLFLNALMAVEKPTWMELPRTPLAQNVMLLNHSHDRKRDLLLEGPEGGLQGLASCVLWKLDFSDDQRTFDTELLELAEMIGEGLNLSSDMIIIPSVATNYTDIHMYNCAWRNKKQHGARFMTRQDSDAMRRRLPFRMSQDVDIFLLRRVAAYRAEQHGFSCGDSGEPELEHTYDNPLIIPVTRALNEPSLENEPMTERDRVEQTKICSGLFRMFLFMDLVKGVDEKGDVRTVKVSMILLQANTPGTDPLVALKQIGEQNSRMSATLLDVLSHMKRVLLNDFGANMSMREAFSTGTQREAARLCCEALLPYAVFRFAGNYNLKHMHFGGMRMDINDEEEMRVWAEYQETVTRARLHHYSRVLDGVNSILKPGGFRRFNVPDENFGLDMYEGVHYRYVDRAKLDAAVEAAIEQTAEDDRPEFALKIYEWGSKLMATEKHVFIADSRPWARNTGVLVELTLDAFPAFQKPGRGKASEERLQCRIPQLIKVAPVLEIYFTNRAETPDPMQIVWKGEHKIIPDLSFLADAENRLPGCVQDVREAMHELATSSVRDMLTASDIRHEDLMQLYGNQPHRVHCALRNVRTKVGLYNQAHVSFNCIVSAVKSTLSNMVAGELLHWAMAARSLLDLRTQSRQNQNMWVSDWRSFMEYIRSAGTDCEVMDETALLAHFAMYTDKVLKLELSFQNNATLDVLTYGQTATFCWQAKHWGMCVKVADVGHSVEVVDRSRPRPASVTINTKKMGSGVDSVADTLGNINNAYGKFIVSAADVRKFYDSRLAKDHTNSRISELSMAALYGSGLPMLPSGKIDLECSNHNTTTGTMLIRTEHMKQASHSEESRAWMANFETTQNDSGTGTGNEKEGWQTTRGLKGMTYVRMFGAPVILIAGNRQDDAFPPSTLGGGRIQSLCSSVLDTVGRFKVSDSSMGVAESVSTGKRDRGNAFYQAFVDGRPVKRPVGTDLWDVLEAAESRDTVPMREITVNLVENNVRFFFLRHLWRKALPFVHRAMTLGVVHSSYGHFSTFDNMTLSVRGLTEGLRRNYLIEHTAFKRNIQGPWQTVSAFSTFAMQITEWCTARAIRCAIDRLDLYKAFQDTVMAFLHVPMTFSAKLSSLHSWLFTNVLDVSSMVLFAYVMYITGFRTHCPMDVLALAARGLSMTPEQKEKYDAFCKAHMHLVTPPVQGMSSAMALSGVRSTRVGVLRPVSADQLVKWFNWEANSDGMAAAKENRACTGASVFVQPSMQFVSRAPAEWAKAAKGEGRDEFTAGSSQRMLAHAYALEQRLCAHEERVRAGHILAPYHFPHVFWEAAHKGTRLPRPDKETGNMDRYELVFEPVWETGHWFCQTITRLGNCSGLMKHFLVLCQLDERTTLTEFVIAIFGPYFEQHARERSDVKFHTGGEWDKPILECTDIFEWGCLPFMRNKRVEGVEVMLCMRLAYYIVAQGLVCSGWKPTAGGYSVLVHLRNMAYMSLELLMLFLHTRVEKTCIPASAGRILLPQRSPAGTGVPATVRFDERLHVDSVPCVDAVLCMRARKEWIVAACDPPYLKYKTCDQGSSGEPFLFPPESVMHMQTHFVMMQRALECLSIDVLQTNPGNCMALAMRQYGLHTSAEMFSFVPVTLTHCVVADAREIPCVTFADGYLFVLTYEACKVCLSPVSMTHSWSIDDGVIPGELFERLPIAKTVRFNPLMLGDVMAHGIQRQSDGSYIVNPRANGEALPAYFFPVVHWPCLVCINLERSVVACKVSVEDMGEDFSTDEVDEVDVQIMEVGEYLQMYAGRTLSACETDAWILENADIERDWFEDMYMRDDVITFTVEIEGSTMVALGKNNLKYLKQNTPLQWEWVHPSHVFYYDDRALPLRRTASGIVAEIYHYENTAYEKCARDISTEKKAIVSLDDTIGRLQREARAVDTLVAARMERKCTLERLCEQLGECKISASLLRTLRVGDEVKTKQVAFPPMAQPCDTIGLVQPHPGTSHYLKDGRYYVTTFHAAKNEKDATVLDFVTMSRCMVREGAQMWIRIDADLLSDLNMLGFTLPNSEVATEVLAEETMAQLSAFYVLGGTVEGEHVRKAKVHMFVHILGHGLRRIPFRVFDSEGNEKITPYKSSLHEFDELVLLDECVLDVNIE